MRCCVIDNGRRILGDETDCGRFGLALSASVISRWSDMIGETSHGVGELNVAWIMCDLHAVSAGRAFDRPGMNAGDFIVGVSNTDVCDCCDL